MPLDLPVPTHHRPRSKTADAAEYIMRLISDGKLSAGTRVPQVQVAAALGVSIVPVREALQRLERDGWVTIEAHRGAFVNPITAEGIETHYEFSRLVLEHFIRSAFKRGSPEVRDKFRKIADELGRTDSPEDGWRLVGRFQETLISDMPDSKRAETMMHTVVASSFGPGNTFAAIPAVMSYAKEALVEVAVGFEIGDLDRAVGATDQLVRRTAREMIRHYRASGVIDGPA